MTRHELQEGGAPALPLRIWRLADRSAADLPPASFALVMATGIVSLAAHGQDHVLLARAMFALNIVFVTALWALKILRLSRHSSRIASDLRSHATGVGFFTLVAAHGVFGMQMMTLAGLPALAGAIWVISLVLLAVIGFSLFLGLITAPHKPNMRRGLNGMWLLAVVATQSIAVLGGAVAPDMTRPDFFILISMFFFLAGCMLYILIIVPIFFRLIFVPLPPEEMSWPYWICMGATAITTQAGGTLLLDGGSVALLTEIRPFLLGFTLFFWVAGTCWIPLLVALGVWAHGVRRVPLRYGPQVWGAVFPLGMYAVCTGQLARAAELAALTAIPPIALAAALAAWVIAVAGLLRRLAREDGALRSW